MTTTRNARHLNNELSSDLHAAAARLSPNTERSASESGCTDTRPTGPRAARAWDMVRLCHHLNSFCDLEAESAAFIAVTEGKPFVAPPVAEHDHDSWHCGWCWANDELASAVALWQHLFPKGWGTPVSRAEAELERRTQALDAARSAEWDATRNHASAARALEWAVRSLNDRL